MELQIFCAKCQEVTKHVGSIDQNGEYVFHCTNVSVPDPKNPEGTVYHHFLKLPANFDLNNLPEYLKIHEDANKGQVSIEAQEKRLADAIAAINGAAATPAQTTETTQPETPAAPTEGQPTQ